nr:ComEC/Rec2 family competence protein [Wenxinia saemankumensis]
MVAAAIARQRGHGLTWVPVALGTGIGIYFALPAEPGSAAWAALGAGALVLLALAARAGESAAPLFVGVALVACGAGLAGLRTASTAAPVLGFRYYGPIEGRVVEIDRSGSDALRLTLDRVVLEDMAPARTPARVRVSLHGDQHWTDPAPGLTVILTGHLSPPSGPVEPGGFDFRRTAWFERLGAVGYTRTPVLTLARAEEGRAGLAVHRARAALSDWISARMDGDAGGFVSAVTTGDRSGLSPRVTEAMRDANLYHLVSISGMHMGMLVAVVFALVRGSVAAIPPLALRLSSRKVAALAALPVAAAYLALAGRAVPTERAFVMVAVMLGAVLLDRRALTLRAVAVAALIVLVLRPETLTNAGFQMSFAAVIALVVAFARLPYLPRTGAWRWVGPVLTLAFSSLVAGLATAPFAAAHFNRVAHYGVLANLLAVPAMAFVVMPGAVAMALLAPLGLAAPAVAVTEAGARWILWVAERVAALEGAASSVKAPPGAVLPLLAAGGLVFVLWHGRGRWAGLAPLAVAGALWAGADRPALLVAESGSLLGFLTPEGRALTKGVGESFAAGTWLENDGSGLTQAAAAGLPGWTEAPARTFRAELPGGAIIGVRGAGALAALDGCGGAAILVADRPVEGGRPCAVYDAPRLRGTGALAIRSDEAGLVVESAADRAGDRPWTRR